MPGAACSPGAIAGARGAWHGALERFCVGPRSVQAHRSVGGGGAPRGRSRAGGRAAAYLRRPRCLRDDSDLIFSIPKWIAHDMQYHFRTFGDAMYAPCARSSLARVRSTRLRRDVTFLALSRGTVCPQLVHWTTPDDPLPPFLRPLLALFSGIMRRRHGRAPSYIVCAPAPAASGRLHCMAAPPAPGPGAHGAASLPRLLGPQAPLRAVRGRPKPPAGAPAGRLWARQAPAPTMRPL